MKKLEELYRIFDTIAIIAKNINPPRKKIYYLLFYLYLSLKQIVTSILGVEIKKQKIFDRNFYLSDYKAFVTLFAEMFFLKPYEFETSNSKPIIIDAGANIGLASFYFKQRYPGSTIICFEPSKKTFGYLKKNLAGLENIEFVNSALADAKKTGYLFVPKSESSGVNSSIFNRWSGINFSKEKTSFVKLSSYIDKFKTVDFVKLDIEGAEESVLEELERKRLLPKIKEMFVEYHNFKNNSLAKITTILEKNHFKIITYGGIRSPYPPLKNTYWCLSIFAYR